MTNLSGKDKKAAVDVFIEIVEAASSNDAKTVAAMLDAGYEINRIIAREKHGEELTVLSLAVSSGSEAVVRLLLERGADVNLHAGKHPVTGKMPLTVIAIHNILLSNDTDYEDMKVSLAKYWPIFRLLLNHGLSITEVNTHFPRPLALKLINFPEVADDVIQRMAQTPSNVLRRCIYEDLDKISAITLAEGFSRLEVRHLEKIHELSLLGPMIRRSILGIQDELIYMGKIQSIEYLRRIGLFDPEQCDSSGDTAIVRYFKKLFIGQSWKREKAREHAELMVSWFFSIGADFGVSDAEGRSLNFMLKFKADRNMEERLLARFPHVFDGNIDIERVSRTYLNEMIKFQMQENDFTGLSELLKCTPDALREKLHSFCSDGKSVMTYAAEKAAPEVCEVLVAHGFDPNRPDMKGTLPIHAAAQNGRVDTMMTLFNLGADPLLPDALLGRDVFSLASPQRGKNSARMVSALRAMKSKLRLQSFRPPAASGQRPTPS